MTLNNFQNLNSRKKSIYLLGFFLVFIFLFFVFILKPSIESIEKSRLEILAKKVNIEKNINIEKNKSKLGADLKKIEADLEKFDKIFIKKERDLEFITTLEGAAADLNLTQNISLETESYNEKNTYSTIPINLNVSGDFKNAMDYIAKLDSLIYYIKINSISLEKTEENNIKMSLKADTYWK